MRLTRKLSLASARRRDYRPEPKARAQAGEMSINERWRRQIKRAGQ